VSKKLQGNGLWESSRMMLPEHKLENIKYREGFKRRQRRELDEQELEEVNRLLIESKQTGVIVTLQMFDEWELLQVVGVVERIDQHHRRVMVGGDWFAIHDIERVEDCQ